VDSAAGNVHTGHLDGDRVVADAGLHVDRTVGAVVCSDDGRLLVAGRTALAEVGLDGSISRGTPLLPPSSRFNDGKCDPAGAFLVGSLFLDGGAAPRSEVLLRIGPDGSATTLDDDLTLSNGLGWSPDGTVFYSTDTIARKVYRRPYDPATGAVGDREVFLHVDGGVPDGMAIDADGHLWVAVWGAGEVRRFTPDGVQTGVVKVDAPHSSSAAFAGPDRDLLVITSARWDLSDERLAANPLSGRIFTVRVGVAGLPVAAWRPFDTPLRPS
jgi:sugar lactone lactonase YvrE